MPSVMIKRYFTVGTIFILALGVVVYYYIHENNGTIEQKIERTLGKECATVEIFDEASFDTYKIVGFEYSTEQYGIALIDVEKSTKVLWVRTINEMFSRTDGVWYSVNPISEKTVYSFICTNNEVKTITWVEGNTRTAYRIEEYPCLINIPRNFKNGEYAEYFFTDEYGYEVP